MGPAARSDLSSAFSVCRRLAGAVPRYRHSGYPHHRRDGARVRHHVRALRFYEAKGLLTPQRQGAGAALRTGGARAPAAHPQGQAARLHPRRDTPDARSPAEPGGAGELTMSRAQCFEQIKLLEERKREIEAALAELRRTYSSFYVRLAGSSA